MRLFRGAVGPHFIFMDDNARPYRAHLVYDYLEREEFQYTDWPAMSPDMNHFRACLGCIGGRVAARQPPPRTPLELRNALREEWKQLPAELLNLIKAL